MELLWALLKKVSLLSLPMYLSKREKRGKREEEEEKEEKEEEEEEEEEEEKEKVWGRGMTDKHKSQRNSKRSSACIIILVMGFPLI